ncbi:GNAT family N-acetyltransferase [bacterium]|nr:MAG: GNAT family N-acetyltransferase [bacterium]
MSLTITPATEATLNDVRTLFVEYQAFLNVDLCFQGFEAELASLPKPYEEPEGALVLAYWDDRLAGCAGIKPLGEDVCELKRLFVRPEFRGQGIGRSLGHRMVDEAKQRGYLRMRLDTLARLGSAVALYRALGFVEIPAYYDNPLEERVIYMELGL